jgi:hypothetical protein
VINDPVFIKPRTTPFLGGQVPHEGSQTPETKNGTTNQTFSNGFA